MEGQTTHELYRQMLEERIPKLIQRREQAQVNPFKGEMVVSLRCSFRPCCGLSQGDFWKARDRRKRHRGNDNQQLQFKPQKVREQERRVVPKKRERKDVQDLPIEF